MKIFLLIGLLFSLIPIQKIAGERVKLTKITDLEEVKRYIKRAAPLYVNFEPCGQYFVIATQRDPRAARKMIYWQGKDANGKDIVKAVEFPVLEVQTDNSLKVPEVLVRPSGSPGPEFFYLMSYRDYKKMPCFALNK